MSATLPLAVLARHGETAWSLSGRHTGRTDLPLTAAGEAAARRLRERLARVAFAQVRTSPSQRARRTCELAGYAAHAVVDPDLAEWDYGDYEGLTTAEILVRRPTWSLFRDGCPGGETPDDVAARADRVVARSRDVGGNVLLVSSAHILRTVTARWLGLPAGGGRHFVLDTASVSVLGYEHTAAEPVIRSWNDTERAAIPLATRGGTG